MSGQVGRTEPRTSRWYQRRDARFLIFVAVVLAAYFGYGYATGPGRMSDDLHAAMRGGAERLNLVVTTKFPAEEFHFSIYQKIGTIRGAVGKDTYVFNVRPRQVRALSRKYWIELIDLAPDEIP